VDPRPELLGPGSAGEGALGTAAVGQHHLVAAGHGVAGDWGAVATVARAEGSDPP